MGAGWFHGDAVTAGRGLDAGVGGVIVGGVNMGGA